MQISALLEGVHCTCGRYHTCPIRHVFIGNNVIAQLENITKEYETILLVADENTYRAAGRETEEALQGKSIQKVIFPGNAVLIPDENAISRITESMEGVQLIIGIGSGVIQDLCKYVSFFSGVPYYIVATAPSMDGYASTGAAMILQGMKVTVSARVPEAIIADTKVLKDAPMEMICAGYGDVVGKYSALNDWLLSHTINGEYFCPFIYDLTARMVEKTLKLAGGLQKREEESIGVLMEALVVVGIAMSFAGSSRPASGSEHHLSHFFEISGIVHGEPYFTHGIDVAYSTVITAALREKLLAEDWPDIQYCPSQETYCAAMEEIYGPVAAGCIALQEKAGLYEKDMISIYKSREERIRKILSEMPKAAEIKVMLSAVGLDMQEFYNMYSEKKIADAIAYGKDLKDRYTVLWLYYHLLGREGE